MAVVEARNLWKHYPGKHALKNVSLTVQEGEILVVVGPSGAGKTTLLRILDLLEEPTSGEVYINGVNAFQQTAEERLRLMRSMGLTLQQPVMFNTTVFENVAYSLRLRGLDGRSLKDRVEHVLRLLGLEDSKWRKATSLSGGEAQRVSLARVLVYNPSLVLLDEPTANLDPTNVAIFESFIQRMNREHGTTVVMATHNMFQARRLAHRVGLLFDGELVELTDKETFFTNPKTNLSRAFVRGELVF